MMDVCQRLSFAWGNSERLSSFQPVHGHFFSYSLLTSRDMIVPSVKAR